MWKAACALLDGTQIFMIDRIKNDSIVMIATVRTALAPVRSIMTNAYNT